ncbi:MAG: hypothetical protein Ta2F_06870 [Termitinemataceae bacterium]|nr:MAG: hypothetical protein Ta2F_06870 [Termitinemataceae bacterium]
MKNVRNVFLVVGLLFAATMVMAAGKTKEKVEVLENKGTSRSLKDPAWLTAYISSGISAVEALDLYKGKYCFIIEHDDLNKDFAIAWVGGAEAPRAVAAKIATTVSSSMSNASGGGGSTGSAGEMSYGVKSAAEAIANASFNGLTKDADWWETRRNKKTKEVTTTATALFLIDKKQLDTQVAAQLQRLADQNTAMSAAEKAIYADMIAQVRGVGGFGSLSRDD